MEVVAAPQGFEGSMYYCDGTRSWKVSFRLAGDKWWTACHMDAGHAHTPREERHRRAEEAVRQALVARGLLPHST